MLACFDLRENNKLTIKQEDIHNCIVLRLKSLLNQTVGFEKMSCMFNFWFLFVFCRSFSLQIHNH